MEEVACAGCAGPLRAFVSVDVDPSHTRHLLCRACFSDAQSAPPSALFGMGVDLVDTRTLRGFPPRSQRLLEENMIAVRIGILSTKSIKKMYNIDTWTDWPAFLERRWDYSFKVGRSYWDDEHELNPTYCTVKKYNPETLEYLTNTELDAEEKTAPQKKNIFKVIAQSYFKDAYDTRTNPVYPPDFGEILGQIRVHTVIDFVKYGREPTRVDYCCEYQAEEPRDGDPDYNKEGVHVGYEKKWVVPGHSYDIYIDTLSYKEEEGLEDARLALERASLFPNRHIRVSSNYLGHNSIYFSKGELKPGGGRGLDHTLLRVIIPPGFYTAEQFCNVLDIALAEQNSKQFQGLFRMKISPRNPSRLVLVLTGGAHVYGNIEYESPTGNLEDQKSNSLSTELGFRRTYKYDEPEMAEAGAPHAEEVQEFEADTDYGIESALRPSQRKKRHRGGS